MAKQTAKEPGKSLGAVLLGQHIERLGITYAEAALALRAAGADSVGRASVCHWVNAKHAPSRRNAAAVQEWSGGAIPAPAWDKPGGSA